jgi:hypothetical protein
VDEGDFFYEALILRVKDHQKDVAEFARESKSSNDNVAQFAKGTLPTLKSHIQQAEKIAPQSSSSTKAGAE